MSVLTVSWSSLRVWEECQHKAGHRMKHNTIRGPKMARIFLPGTLADRVMRAWLEQESPELGWMHEAVPEFFKKYTSPETEEFKDSGVIAWRGKANEDQRLVQNFVREVVGKLEPFLWENVVPYRYQPELRFRTPIAIPYLDGKLTSIELIGGIDIVQQDDVDDFNLFDLKATTDDDYVKKVLGQGLFYDIAWGHYIGDQSQPKTFGFITPACKERVVYANYTDDDRRAMMQRIIAYAHGVWKKEFPVKKSDSGCDSFCEAYHVCDKFKVVFDKDTSGRNRASFAQTAAVRLAARGLTVE